MAQKPTSGFKAALEWLLAKKLDNLSVRQLNLLIETADGSQTVRGLSEQMGVSKPAISRAATRLESEGLVMRCPDVDKRSVLIDITAAGRELAIAITSAKLKRA